MTNELHPEQGKKETTVVPNLLSAVGFEFEPATLSYNERDLSLYALSVGAAADPLDPLELPFVYELSRGGLKPLPTFAATFPFSLLWQITAVPGLKFNPALLLHGEQTLQIKKPLPLSATITNKARIGQIYDKGSAALVLLDVDSFDEKGEAIAFNRLSLFIRGMGGFGGERGPSSAAVPLPERPPDIIHREKTQPNQALLYRLSSGDRNPLHADPVFAAAGGFERPILHGLCTFGFAGRAVLRHYAGNDPARLNSIQARFAKHVFPGETLITEMWHNPADESSEGHVSFRCRVEERDEIVLSNGAIGLSSG